MSKKEKQIKYKVIGCKNCGKTSGDSGVTLIKGPDSYYCKDCYNYLVKKGKIKHV